MGAVCFAAKLKKKNGDDYHNIEFVDIETPPMVSYDEFRPQSQTDMDSLDSTHLDSTHHDPDEDDSVQANVDSKPDDTKVDNDLE